MKKLFVLFTLLSLSGCGDARSYALQDQFCADKGGVYIYAQDTAGLSKAWCNDNTVFTYDTRP